MRFLLLVLVLLCSPLISLAEEQADELQPEQTEQQEGGFLSSLINGGRRALCSDNYALILPVYMWHDRNTYDRDHTDKYNEIPWGGGLEKFYIDTNGNRHSVYGMVFADSYYYPEPMIGYAWQKIFRMAEDFRAGLGYSLLITTKHSWGWEPSPGILPLASLGYKRAAIQAAWVPYLGYNNGNVWFFTLGYNL